MLSRYIMAKPTIEQKKKIKRIEQEIKEESSLWDKIKAIPKEDKWFSKQLRNLVRFHKITKKPKVPKAVKKRVNKLFWGLEPPEKPKKRAKKKSKR